MFQYFLKAVSTQFRTIDGKVVNTHQYQVTHYNRDAGNPQDKTNQGVNVMHGITGVPGEYFLLTVGKWTRSWRSFIVIAIRTY